jgi:ATP phosphoribosyltransferase
MNAPLPLRPVAPDPLRLKIAIQKSGRLTDSSLDLLSRCGLKFSRGKDQLMCHGENMPLDVLFVRDDDIPDLVQEDVCDLGLVGLNVVEEKRLAFQARGISPLFESVQLLDFGRCKLCIAVPDGFDYRDASSLEGRRIATTYPHILARFLSERGITAEVVVLSGSVEIAPRLGRADVICDLVSSGSTLAANHLRQVEIVMESQAALIRTPVPIPEDRQDWARRLLMRIDGVEQVKGSKYIMLHAPRSALPAIAKLLPGSEAPTVIPLEGRGDRVAVHAVCRESVFWELLEDLKSVGASSVLVLPVEKMLA